MRDDGFALATTSGAAAGAVAGTAAGAVGSGNPAAGAVVAAIADTAWKSARAGGFSS